MTVFFSLTDKLHQVDILHPNWSGICPILELKLQSCEAISILYPTHSVPFGQTWKRRATLTYKSNSITCLVSLSFPLVLQLFEVKKMVLWINSFYLY